MTAYGASDATSHYNPIVSSFIKTQIDLTFLVPAYTGCPGTEAIKQMSVSLSGRVTGRAERHSVLLQLSLNVLWWVLVLAWS